jgi:hypothetical protein
LTLRGSPSNLTLGILALIVFCVVSGGVCGGVCGVASCVSFIFVPGLKSTIICLLPSIYIII